MGGGGFLGLWGCDESEDVLIGHYATHSFACYRVSLASGREYTALKVMHGGGFGHEGGGVWAGCLRLWGGLRMCSLVFKPLTPLVTHDSAWLMGMPSGSLMSQAVEQSQS